MKSIESKISIFIISLTVMVNLQSFAQEIFGLNQQQKLWFAAGGGLTYGEKAAGINATFEIDYANNNNLYAIQFHTWFNANAIFSSFSSKPSKLNFVRAFSFYYGYIYDKDFINLCVSSGISFIKIYRDINNTINLGVPISLQLMFKKFLYHNGGIMLNGIINRKNSFLSLSMIIYIGKIY